MDTMTKPRTLSPSPLPFVAGDLVAADDLGKVHIWDHPITGPRILIIGQRHLVANAAFHILIDEDITFFNFRPGSRLQDGGPLDVVFASTQPLTAKATIVIKVKVDGKLRLLGTYYVQKRRLVAQDVEYWRIVSGFPLPVVDAETARRQGEAAVLLDNFKALKNDWPQLGDPAIATEKNVDTPVPDVEHRQRIQGAVASLDDPKCLPGNLVSHLSHLPMTRNGLTVETAQLCSLLDQTPTAGYSTAH